MSAHEQATHAAMENQAFALMGRLHVTLRRQNGRITDIEYMRIDPVYCRYVLDMALQLPNQELQHICEKLQEIYFGTGGLFMRAPPKPPALERLGGAVAAPLPRSAHPGHMKELGPEMSMPISSDESVEVDRGYIGRLR